MEVCYYFLATLLRGMYLEIIRIQPESPEWSALVAHLKDGNDARWVLDEKDQPKEERLIFLGAQDGDQVVGNLTLRCQPVSIPHTEWAGERDRGVRDDQGDPLYETFVQTFRVAEVYWRKGIGRELQLKALEITRQEGCIQMRSWSSLDAQANYQLKFALGFAFHPEVQKTPSGLRVSGGYFVKRV